MLATLSPDAQGALFLVAIILFTIAAVYAVTRRSIEIALIAAGLAFFALPWCWNAFTV